ncbi:hypothetical protein [Roseibium litorale]|uniref:Uncharacterized protein n=1 Tax=Roseibium litorale TaxID=2803841 RepID=A0ABR9CR80_9HYPH|nr:hypothetical protein [Roseibium litorale]MBD8892782.1 hypothetical protein [Roseibium litorale]
MSRSNRSSLACRFLPRNPFFRLLVTNGVIGAGVSILLVGGIFAADIGHLRILVANAQNPVLPVVLLACGMMITLTSAVIGTAIMMLGPETDGRGGRRQPSGELIPVRVAARAYPRR